MVDEEISILYISGNLDLVLKITFTLQKVIIGINLVKSSMFMSLKVLFLEKLKKETNHFIFENFQSKFIFSLSDYLG